MAKTLVKPQKPFYLLGAYLILGLTQVWFFLPRIVAQCATCKAAAASENESGELIVGEGLNTGILYLLAMPFVISAVIGLLWYRNRKKIRELSS